jgi:hypothetical protein
MKIVMHIVPVSDTGCWHRLTADCACKPHTKSGKGADVVTHNLVGSGPDKWKIKTRNK